MFSTGYYQYFKRWMLGDNLPLNVIYVFIALSYIAIVQYSDYIGRLSSPFFNIISWDNFNDFFLNNFALLSINLLILLIISSFREENLIQLATTTDRQIVSTKHKFFTGLTQLVNFLFNVGVILNIGSILLVLLLIAGSFGLLSFGLPDLWFLYLTAYVIIHTMLCIISIKVILHFIKTRNEKISPYTFTFLITSLFALLLTIVSLFTAN